MGITAFRWVDQGGRIRLHFLFVCVYMCAYQVWLMFFSVLRWKEPLRFGNRGPWGGGRWGVLLSRLQRMERGEITGGGGWWGYFVKGRPVWLVLITQERPSCSDQQTAGQGGSIRLPKSSSCTDEAWGVFGAWHLKKLYQIWTKWNTNTTL